MIYAAFDAITFNILRALEWLFDEIEYRLAERAVRQAARIKAARRRSTQKILANEGISSRISEQISVKST
jgi:hypothetical protein